MHVIWSVAAGAVSGLLFGVVVGDVPFGMLCGIGGGAGMGGALYAWTVEGTHAGRRT